MPKLKAILPILFYVCFLMHSVKSKCENVRATVTQRLINEGFHRNIQYVINFNEYNGVDLWSHGACSLSIEQILPSGAFVNADELHDMRRLNKVNACPVGEVDIEKPAQVSRPIMVHMYAPVNSSRIKITLPIHLRYHSPKVDGGFEVFNIGYPWIFLRCPNNVFKMCKPADTVLAPCGACSLHRCSWHNISVTPLTSILELSVPVGDLNDLTIVTIASLVVSFGGCFYIMFNLFATNTLGPKINSYSSMHKKYK